MHTMNLQYMAVTKDSDSWPHSLGNLFTAQVVLYYMKRFCHPLSGVCHITGTRRKGKGLEVSCKYRGKYNLLLLTHKKPGANRELEFIFAIMLFLLATKQDQVFI